MYINGTVVRQVGARNTLTSAAYAKQQRTQELGASLIGQNSMKLYATVGALKNVNGKLVNVQKGQGSNQSLSIAISVQGVRGCPTLTNAYMILLNVGNDNELHAEILDYSTGETTQLTKGEKQKGEDNKCRTCGYSDAREPHNCY